MRQFRTFAFLDGGYLRELAQAANVPWVDPHWFAAKLCQQSAARSIGVQPSALDELTLHRTNYYDAMPDNPEATRPDYEEYWRAIEVLPDTHLGFGVLRRSLRNGPKQKGVDTLMVVDMLSGAFDRRFDMALLVAGDADFVPAVRELSSRGIHILLAADLRTLADDLRRASDRFVSFEVNPSLGLFRSLESNGRTFGNAGTRA